MAQSTIEVDPSQVHSIEVDASQVSLVPAEKSAWEKFKGHLQTPGIIRDLYGTYTGDPAATYRLGETAAGMAEGLKQEPLRIWNESRNLGESMVRGDIPGMAYHAAGMVPILGGQTQSIAQRFGEGAPAEATAEAVDLAAQLVGPKAIERPAARIGRAAGAVYDTGAGAVEAVRSMSPEMRHAAGVGTGAVIGGTVGHAVGGAPGGAIGEVVGAYVGGKASRALAREPGAAIERPPVGPTLEQATPVGPTVEQAAPAAPPPPTRPVPSDYPKIKAWAEAQPGGVTLGMIQRQFGANYAEAAAFADALTEDGIPVVSKVKGLGSLPTQPEPVETPEPPVAEEPAPVAAPPPAAERYQPAEPKPAPTAEWMRQNVYTRRGGMQPPPETPPTAPETPAAAPETAGPPPAAPAPEASLATELRAWAEAQPNGVSPASIQRQFGLPYNAALDVAESLMRDGWKWTEDRRLVKPEATAPTPEPAPAPPPAETPAATAAPGSVEDLSAQLNAELGTKTPDQVRAEMEAAQQSAQESTRAVNNRAAKADKLSDAMFQNGKGLTVEQADQLTDDQIKSIAKAAGIPEPDTSIPQARELLKAKWAERQRHIEDTEFNLRPSWMKEEPVEPGQALRDWQAQRAAREATSPIEQVRSLAQKLMQEGHSGDNLYRDLSPQQFDAAAKAAGIANPRADLLPRVADQMRAFERAAEPALGLEEELGKGDSARVAASAGVSPMAKPRGRALSGAEVTARALDLVRQSGEELLAEYQRRFGNVFNADDAAELFPDYSDSVDARTKYRDAVHPAAQWIRDTLFERSLRDPNVKEIVFTAGGPGAGKSGGALRTGEVVMDTMLSGPTRPTQMIQAALDAGKQVQITYTYRPIQEALKGVLERSKTEGRTVPLDYLIENHEGAARNVATLYERYAANPDVHFRFVDNTAGSNGEGTIALTRKQNYRGTRNELESILEANRSEITPSVYRATKGSGRRTTGGRDRSTDAR